MPVEIGTLSRVVLLSGREEGSALNSGNDHNFNFPRSLSFSFNVPISTEDSSLLFFSPLFVERKPKKNAEHSAQ